MPKFITFIVHNEDTDWNKIADFFTEAQKGIPSNFSFPSVELHKEGLPPVKGITVNADHNSEAMQSFLLAYTRASGEDVERIKTADGYLTSFFEPGKTHVYGKFSEILQRRGLDPEKMDHLVILCGKQSFSEAAMGTGHVTESILMLMEGWNSQDRESRSAIKGRMEESISTIKEAKGEALMEAVRDHLLLQHSSQLISHDNKYDGMITYEAADWDAVNLHPGGLKPIAVFFTPDDAEHCAEHIRASREHPPISSGNPRTLRDSIETIPGPFRLENNGIRPDITTLLH